MKIQSLWPTTNTADKSYKQNFTKYVLHYWEIHFCIKEALVVSFYHIPLATKFN